MGVYISTKLTNKLPQLAAQLPARADAIAQDTAERIVDTAIAAMDQPKSGEMYGTHQASAPGEAPAIVSGDLAGSLGIENDGVGRRTVYSDDDTAALLEFGSAGGQLAPRPFLTPAAESERERFEEQLAQDLLR